jgi:hypothetical protein
MLRNPFAFQGHIGPFYESDNVTGFTGASVLEGNSLTATEHVNVQAYHTLFIHSSLGTHNDTLAPRGQTSVARKVIVDVPPGQMINDYRASQLDYIDLEKQSIPSISFRITDWQGHKVKMSEWSCSITLVEEDQF